MCWTINGYLVCMLFPCQKSTAHNRPPFCPLTCHHDAPTEMLHTCQERTWCHATVCFVFHIFIATIFKNYRVIGLFARLSSGFYFRFTISSLAISPHNKISWTVLCLNHEFPLSIVCGKNNYQYPIKNLKRAWSFSPALTIFSLQFVLNHSVPIFSSDCFDANEIS